jgi:hypothetical protein
LKLARPSTRNTGLRLYPAPRATNDWLRLQDQDEVPGRFLGWEDGAVRWEMAEALRPVRFRGSGVDRLVWAAPEKPAWVADRWVVRLTDGSLLPAQEARLEEKTVVAIGTAAGTLRLRREMVAALYRNPYPADKGHILHNIEDWEVVSTTNARSGSVGNSRGSGRQSYAEVLPPEPVLVEFDWPVTDANSYIHVLLPLPSFQNLRGDFRLYFHNNEMIVQYPGGAFTGAEEVSGTRPRVGVALDPRRGTTAVYLDGKLVGNPLANLPFEPVPRGISVYCGTSKGSATGTLPIRTLLITPIREELTFPTAPGNADLIRFANGDALTGALTGLTDTHVSITGPLGAVELPVERFAVVEFATDGRAEPRRRDNDVELQFHDGSQLVGELKEITADHFILDSDAFGRATVPRADVRGLQLGLHQPAPPVTNPEVRREIQPGVIGLRGGNLLNGRLLGVTAQTLTWQHPHALDPLEFALTNVAFANLAGSPANPPPSAARVRLTNGDQWHGELVGVDAQSVQLRPLHTTPVRIPRRHVAEVRPAASPEGVMEAGPIEKWKVSASTYVRSLPLPPRVRFQFEIEPRNTMLWQQVWLYSRLSTNKSHQGPVGYQLSLQYNQIGVAQYILNPAGQLKQQNLTSHAAPGLGERPVSEMTWLLDTVKGETFVLLDGKPIGQMRRLQKTNLGQEIRFLINDPPCVRLRSVLVSEWNGGTDFVAPAKTDAVRLHDFSLLAGPIEGVRDGLVHRTGQDPVPLARVSSLLFNPADSESAPRTAQDVRLTLWNGDELTLAGLQWGQGGLTGTSEVWGQVTIPVNAIRRLSPLRATEASK